jgi:hypothetical protein
VGKRLPVLKSDNHTVICESAVNKTRDPRPLAPLWDSTASYKDYFTFFLPSAPLTEMITRNIKIIMFLGSNVRRVRRANNLTAICEPIV